MKQRKRIDDNAQQSAVIWARYQRGDPLHDIAKDLDRSLVQYLTLAIDLLMPGRYRKQSLFYEQ
jgi:hypothetical protein